MPWVSSSPIWRGISAAVDCRTCPAALQLLQPAFRSTKASNTHASTAGAEAAAVPKEAAGGGAIFWGGGWRIAWAYMGRNLCLSNTTPLAIRRISMRAAILRAIEKMRFGFRDERFDRCKIDRRLFWIELHRSFEKISSFFFFFFGMVNFGCFEIYE